MHCIDPVPSAMQNAKLHRYVSTNGPSCIFAECPSRTLAVAEDEGRLPPAAVRARRDNGDASDREDRDRDDSDRDDRAVEAARSRQRERFPRN